MTVPANKDELLKAIDLNFDKVIQAFRDVPLPMVKEHTMEGHAKGTMMSTVNLAAYLLGWNELVLKWLDRDAIGKPIDFPESGFKWNELGKLAQKFYRDYEDIPWATLLIRLESAKGKIVSEIIVRNDHDLYGKPWCGKWPMGRMIQFNTSSPYANARNRLRKWLATKS